MNLIQDDFSEELSTLLKKHNKTIESDKNGIYIVDGSHKTLFISTPTTGSEDWRSKLIFII